MWSRGWRIRDRIVMHGGSTGGYFTLCMILPIPGPIEGRRLLLWPARPHPLGEVLGRGREAGFGRTWWRETEVGPIWPLTTGGSDLPSTTWTRSRPPLLILWGDRDGVRISMADDYFPCRQSQGAVYRIHTVQLRASWLVPLASGKRAGFHASYGGSLQEVHRRPKGKLGVSQSWFFPSLAGSAHGLVLRWHAALMNFGATLRCKRDCLNSVEFRGPCALGSYLEALRFRGFRPQCVGAGHGDRSFRAGAPGIVDFVAVPGNQGGYLGRFAEGVIGSGETRRPGALLWASPLPSSSFLAASSLFSMAQW